MEQVKIDPLLGRDIAGRYRIEEKIGEGGMGSVYRARNVVTGKLVAIKVLLQDLAAYDSFVQRFLHEARAAAYLNHPHAINIIDSGRDGEVVYLLMEYVEGRTLTQVMREEGPFSAERAANILKQICAAVAEAHHQSIVHRDLKPDNIMLQSVAGETDYVKVLDFGIAKVLDEQKRGNMPVTRNIFVGTPEYASPEQCNSKNPTHVSDIYSLGTILYEMLTGAPPFIGEPMQVMVKHVNERPPSVREIRPDLSPEVELILRRALSKNPQHRQHYVLELAQEFEAAVFSERREGGETAAAVRNGAPAGQLAAPPHPTEMATLSRQRGIRDSLYWLFRSGKRRLLVGLATLIVVAGTGRGYQFYRWYQTTPVLPAPPQLALPLPPSTPAHPLAVAQRLFDEGNRDGAVREIQRLLEEDQGYNPEAHRLLGVIYFDQGDYVGAQTELDTATKQMDGSYPEAQFWLGQLLLQRGQEADAEAQFDQAVAGSQRRHLPSLVALGELALHRGQQDKAEGLFREVISAAGDSPEDVLQVGKVLLARGQYDLAARELRRAITNKQGVFPEAELYLGIALTGQSDLKGAAEALSQALAHRGGNYPDARMASGTVLYDQSQYTQAIDELKAAIRLRGGNFPQAELSLGTVLADWAIGQYDEAQRQLQLAITHHGGSFPEAERALGRLYLARLGQLSEARKVWSRLEDQVGLDQTKDAILLRAGGSGLIQRVIGTKPLESGDTIAFNFAPLASGGQPPVITFRVGAGGVRVRMLPAQEGRAATWLGAVLTADGERLLQAQPISNQLMRKDSAELSIHLDRSQVLLRLDGQEIGRYLVEPPTQVLAIIGDGHAVVYNLRESKGMDNR
jgi:tetratricopeptide (TPR) repeat protein